PCGRTLPRSPRAPPVLVGCGARSHFFLELFFLLALVFFASYLKHPFDDDPPRAPLTTSASTHSESFRRVPDTCPSVCPSPPACFRKRRGAVGQVNDRAPRNPAGSS